MTAKPGDAAALRRPAASTDVARLAGVSQKTVSRVMNGEKYVTDDVRRRVLEAATQLNYRRNGSARALTSGRTQRIGVVSLGTSFFGPSTILTATERAARRHGYGMSVVFTTEDDNRAVLRAVEAIAEQGVDGLVLSEPIDNGPLRIDVDVPVLTLERNPGLSARNLLGITPFSERAGYVATRHLLDLGHTQIRHVAGPYSWWSARDREEGWRRAMVDAGLEPGTPQRGDWLPASGYAIGRLLADDRTMTAVFVANDDMALALIRGLHDGGRRVPDEVSVIGVDDIPLAGYASPRLTTISQRFDDAVEDGITRLITAITGEDAADTDTRSVPEPAVIVRESTAPPRSTSRRRRSSSSNV